MRDLQVSLPCFKKTKLASAFWTESILPECREVLIYVTLCGIKFRKQSEGAKTTPGGGFTPSEQPTGRRLFEARGEFRPLRRAT